MDITTNNIRSAGEYLGKYRKWSAARNTPDGTEGHYDQAALLTRLESILDLLLESILHANLDSILHSFITMKIPLFLKQLILYFFKIRVFHS